MNPKKSVSVIDGEHTNNPLTKEIKNLFSIENILTNIATVKLINKIDKKPVIHGKS